ncbi:MAG: DUF2950 family protein [Bryobacteraceae bacterium]
MSHSTSHQIVLLSVMLMALTSCTKPVKHSAQNAVPTTFASPSDAGAALLAAAQSGDRSAFLAIFGPDGGEVLFTGDAAQDAANLRGFVEAYTRMNRWEKIKAGGEVLHVGADNSAFPVPLGRNPSGQWYFDTAAGKDEVLARRIGKNELTAITACEATANAQKQYFSEAHQRGPARQYADKLVSDPGKQNGLYWPVAEGHAASPLGDLGDFTKAVASNTGDHPALFNGYYYRVVPKPGDFAVLAYPAEYQNSGIMTFLVGKDGAVYQKDLGEKTGDVALAMTDVNPADGWSPATVQTGTASRSQ